MNEQRAIDSFGVICLEYGRGGSYIFSVSVRRNEAQRSGNDSLPDDEHRRPNPIPIPGNSGRIQALGSRSLWRLPL